MSMPESVTTQIWCKTCLTVRSLRGLRKLAYILHGIETNRSDAPTAVKYPHHSILLYI